MPTSKEVVPNRPLGGAELKAILEKDFESMLRGDGMFSAHMAYKRVAYEITIKLHVDNPMFPDHENKRVSRDPAKNATEPQKMVEAPPLKNPGSNSSVVAFKRTRVVDSPNVARLQNDLPVLVNSVDRTTGQVVERKVQYDKEGVAPIPADDTDISVETAHAWGVNQGRIENAG